MNVPPGLILQDAWVPAGRHLADLRPLIDSCFTGVATGVKEEELQQEIPGSDVVGRLRVSVLIS